MDHPVGTVVAVDTLRKFIADIFAAAGCARGEAECVAGHLISANLAGHDSHGVIRVPRYILWLQQDFVRAGQTMSVVHETPSHAIVDGNVGFGQSIGEQAVDLGIRKAKQNGLSMIGLRNVGHLGRIGDWGERAAEAGLVSIHFVNVSAGELVAPFGGVDRRFSTNPICIGIPSPDGGIPMLLDFATSLVAEGKVLVASNGGKPVPDNALIGPDGKTSGDPSLLYGPIEGTRVRDSAQGQGALRTFGEHKGSGLAFMCDILGGCLIGGGTSGPVPGGKRTRITNGMVSIYLDPNSFGEADFVQQAQDFAEYVKASRPAAPSGEVLVPGEPEARTRVARLKDGIPLQPDTWAAIVETARGLNVTPPAL
jgi:hydroxycarboxylate dehydrogenase B